MNKRSLAYTATATTLVAPSLAHAHGSGSSLYHYLSNPDHVITFGLLSLAALVITLRSLHKVRLAARREQR